MQKGKGIKAKTDSFIFPIHKRMTPVRKITALMMIANIERLERCFFMPKIYHKLRLFPNKMIAIAKKFANCKSK